MIPMVGVISVRHWARSRSFKLWIPLFLLWVLLLPMAVLMLPVLLIACFIARLNPWEVIATFWGILTSLHDTHIEVDNRDALVLIRIL